MNPRVRICASLVGKIDDQPRTPVLISFSVPSSSEMALFTMTPAAGHLESTTPAPAYSGLFFRYRKGFMPTSVTWNSGSGF